MRLASKPVPPVPTRAAAITRRETVKGLGKESCGGPFQEERVPRVTSTAPYIVSGEGGVGVWPHGLTSHLVGVMVFQK